MIALGTSEAGGIGFDLPTLIDTRLLIQANSGAGKSFAIRRLLEQSHGQVQQIAIDLEGEFSTLREKFDYVIAGKGGDTPATPKTAELLARRLLELGVSAICDLYELPAHDRVRFVRLFLESMMKAPKNLWHPVLIIIDEAHHFCPERGQVESFGAVIDLCTRGRKRGFCSVLATQRLSKLHKDACAELLNKMIGRTSLDIDQQRAADELGMVGKVDRIALRNLNPGQFHAYGPALRIGSKVESGVTLFRVGGVQSHHPKVGNRQLEAPPAPTAKVKAILAKLADLPQEAEQEAKTAAELKRDNSELRRKLTLAEKAQPALSKPCNHLEEIRALKAELELCGKALKKLHAFKDAISKNAALLQKAVETLQQSANEDLTEYFVSESRKTQERMDRQPVIRERWTPPKTVVVESGGRAIGKLQRIKELEFKHEYSGADIPSALKPTQQKIINIIAALERFGISPATRETVAIHAGYALGGGAYNKLISSLRSGGFIDYVSGGLALTQVGHVSADPDGYIPDTHNLADFWLSKVGNSKAKLLRVLIDAYPDSMSRSQVAEKIGEAAGGGAFANKLSSLKTSGLITYPTQGEARASDLLFPEGL